MADMLVRLYDLPDRQPVDRRLAEQSIIVRRAMAYEKHAVLRWVETHFGEGWTSECEVAFGGQPITCMIATRGGHLAGFGCYDATCRGFFGPAGVAEELRGKGVGSGILLACLEAMREAGYAYAIIGGVGPKEFYERVAGATEIAGSTPGVYRDVLR
jgi:GNAT superfamily N-acetyltransferase